MNICKQLKFKSGLQLFLFPNSQQLFHLAPALAGLLFEPFSIAQGQAVASFLQTVHGCLAGGVEALLQGILGHGGDHNHGDVLHVAGFHNLFHVDVEEVAVGFSAEVVEH